MKVTDKYVTTTHPVPRSTEPREQRAVGYIRVSTDMQAESGLSLDAQRAAIERYAVLRGYKLIRICEDVFSGTKRTRPGLQAALSTLQQGADILIVLKFDRFSRSLKHFCELYERYFQTGEKELVAIREAIHLNSWQGRALVHILLVFAQMESEATGERTREAVQYIRSKGYHFGKVPYGKRAITAPEDPRYRILVDNPEQQAVLELLKEWGNQGVGIGEMAARLNLKGIKPPRAERWTKKLIYNLKLRLSLLIPRPFNQQPHTDEELHERLVTLRARGHTYQQIASILNEERWVPRRGRKFTETSVGKLLQTTDETKVLNPRRYLELRIERMEYAHEREHPKEPFKRPGYTHLAALLTEAGYTTPRGHEHWWPAQAQQLLEGRFERYYHTNGKAYVPDRSSDGILDDHALLYP